MRCRAASIIPHRRAVSFIDNHIAAPCSGRIKTSAKAYREVESGKTWPLNQRRPLSEVIYVIARRYLSIAKLMMR